MRKKKIKYIILLTLSVLSFNTICTFANQKEDLKQSETSDSINIEDLDEETLKKILENEEVKEIIKENSINKIKEENKEEIESSKEDIPEELSEVINSLKQPGTLSEAIENAKKAEYSLEVEGEDLTIKENLNNARKYLIEESSSLIKTIWNNSKTNIIIIVVLIIILKGMQICKKRNSQIDDACKD